MGMGAAIDPNELQPPPFDPNAPAPAVGAPMPAPAPVYEGPQLPDVIDQVNAQPLPPGASTGQMPDESAWPPPVPSEAPGMVPPPGAPGAPPPGAPPAAGAAPPTAPGIGQPPDVQQAADEASRARKEETEADIAAKQGEQPGEEERARILGDQVVNKRLADLDRQEAQQKWEAADKAAGDAIDQANAKLKNFKFRDFWANKSSGQKVAAALSVALGAFGAALTKGPNYALQILDKRMDDDHREQVDQLNQLREDQLTAMTGRKDARSAYEAALSGINLTDAAKDKLIASQLEEAAARNQDANAANNLKAYAAKLRSDAAQKELAEREKLRGGFYKEQQEAASANLANTRAAAGGFARGRGKGGGGGGAGRGDALAKFTAAAIDGKTSDQDLAKLGVLAGLKSNQVSAEVSRIRKEHTGGASGLGGLQEDKLSKGLADAWAKENNLAPIVKKQDELSAVLEEVQNAPHNPLEQALAVEKAVSSARGGAASKQALALALNHLGPQFTSMEDLYRAIRSKEIGEKQMENFLGYIRNQLGTAEGEGKKKYDEFDKYIASQPPEKRPGLLYERGRLFSGLHGFGGKGGGAAGGGALPPGIPAGSKDTGRTSKGRPVWQAPDGTLHVPG